MEDINKQNVAGKVKSFSNRNEHTVLIIDNLLAEYSGVLINSKQDKEEFIDVMRNELDSVKLYPKRVDILDIEKLREEAGEGYGFEVESP